MVFEEDERRFKVIYICVSCFYQESDIKWMYNSYTEWKTHITKDHNMKCKHCDVKFKFINEIENHFESLHLYRGLKCSLCNDLFYTVLTFKSHNCKTYSVCKDVLTKMIEAWKMVVNEEQL